MNIIGVTSCSTGIAHTYMAAGAIEKACKKLKYPCRIETQGSIGIEDKLSSKEIAAADLVIFAADVSIIGQERFAGKILYECGSEEFIKNPDKALAKAIEYYNTKL